MPTKKTTTKKRDSRQWLRSRNRDCLLRVFPLLVIFIAIVALVPCAHAQVSVEARSETELRDGWMLQSSCKVKAAGARISRPGFGARDWHNVTVPSTVVAALVADETFRDTYFGENLRSIPGANYPVGTNFSVLPMPRDSPFRCSWWYRLELRLPDSYKGRRVWLDFEGINNRANIWLNGQKIADAKNVAGAYRAYEFDVTPLVEFKRTNVLAVETIAQTEKDLGINWVDWNPAPPDKDMGLWREVYLRTSGPVAIRFPHVVTHFNEGSLAQADLTVEAEVHNAALMKVTGTLSGQIEERQFQQAVTLGPSETRTIRFAAAEFPQLRIVNPKLWWPAQMGPATLHELSLKFVERGELSDTAKIRFGIRTITSEVDARGHRLFRVNGEKILIRGAGWAPDMLLRESAERLREEFRYIRDLNLNTIRLEGKMETEDFYNLADEQGVLVMPGWSCCDYWEQWQKWNSRDLQVATASLRSQIVRIMGHPSALVWLNGSDNPPPAAVEKAYIQVLKETEWPNPYLSSASSEETTVTGPSGVKMTGPYDYVPPDYWLTANGRYGGASGFITETSAGPSVPPGSSLRKMLPASDLAPDSAGWNYHAGSLGFKDLTHFEEAMAAIYGTPSGLDDYERKAQAMAYDSERAMFEAYSGNKYESTGIIQWMLNNAWPSLIWHLYDYYLQPAGGYFGVKKACEPLHVQYRYDDRTVQVVNSRYDGATGLLVTAEVYDLALHEKFSRQAQVDVASDSVTKALTLPDDAFDPAQPVHFVRLKLQNGDGETVSTNFYWISSRKTAYDWGKTTYRYTPVSTYEDFSALQALPNAGPVRVSARTEKDNESLVIIARIENPSPNLAFQVHLGITPAGEDSEILPVVWQENYIALMPGESREISARFMNPHALDGGAELRIAGWNIEPETLHLDPPVTNESAVARTATGTR
jgi:exo-1,4-beta-D-glucosaminidase